MGKFIDLTGQRFGKLLVIDVDHRDKKRGTYWSCKCDCGNLAIISCGNLRKGYTKSCGCLLKETKIFDLIGKRFGKLLVVERAESYKYKCQCDCGNICIVSKYSLAYGQTKSCGCLRCKNGIKKESMVGLKFGLLTVIEESGKTLSGHIKYKCLCNCGTYCEVQGEKLKSGHSRSCGCLQKKIISNRQIANNSAKKLSLGESAFNRLFRSYKKEAKNRELIFELQKEFFKKITTKNCFYCNKEPCQIVKGANGNYIYNGIDRIDSSKGYTEDNVVPCCGRCNEAKMAETQEDFLEWVERVHNYQKEKSNEI